ncbi:MAG: hypothetical protein M0D57_06705 [Sphingobacteriales bacterium JAD_PAG50586_3]|nr:MAG: hypothetical protein M0D57_06705 [Sphingobacteriales bacterium JAD_PAG50586_3]
MKKLLPILFLTLATIAFNSSCKKEPDEPQDTIPPTDTTNINDTLFTASSRYVVYIDSANNITRMYRYSSTNNLFQYIIYSTLNDSIETISTYNGDNVMTKQRVYIMDTNNLAKYCIAYENGVEDYTLYFSYSNGRLVQLYYGGDFDVQWSNSNIVTCLSSYGYDTSRVAKVDLFSPAVIESDNKLTGQSPLNNISYSYVHSGISGQGNVFGHSNTYLADSSDYVTKIFRRVNSGTQQVKGSFSYYTYIVE